jgi:type III secretion system YscQ/HrcQ family protein
MATATTAAFPYSRWPRVTRSELRLLRRALRGLRWDGQRRALAEAETLLGASVTITPAAAVVWPPAAARAALADAPLALWLEQRVGARDAAILCQLAPELGARLVDRVLGGDGRAAHVPGDALDELSAGVLAYLAARMAAAASGELRVRGVLLDPMRAAGMLGEGRVVCWPVALALDGRVCGGARVLVGEDDAERLASVASGARDPTLPHALRAVPLTLCAHVARVALRQSELAGLACGDVVLPERCALARDGAGYAGQVWLHAIGGRNGFRCSARGHELTIDGLDATGDEAMSEGKRIETQALDISGEALRATADAPIELCIELARFTLPLGELSALRAGEVLCTGRAIGELVTLSAGGRAFARGELCEVEGEIGVRVTELMR